MGVSPWPEAWQRALYQPGHGFYRRHVAGRHFATPAQGIPGGTALLARAVAALAIREDVSAVVEIGAGGGELLTQLARMLPGHRLAGSDVRARPPGLPAEVAWYAARGGAPVAPGLHDVLSDALVVAVEWLDAVPCPVVEVDAGGAPRLVLVDTATGAERLGPEPTAADLDWCRRWWPIPAEPGARVEIGRPRDAAWAALLERLRGGLALAVDYGHEAAQRPPTGTLTGYRDGRVVRPVPDGTCDITAHVAVDALAQTTRARQRTALPDLTPPPAAPDLATAARDPAAYARDLATAAAWARLVDPLGMGGFWWVTARP